MLDNFGDRQQLLLRALHTHKTGLTIDELANRLAVTRTAVKQHLTALEQGGYIERGGLRVVTRGRPGRAFRLTGRGVDLFPKQYSWFSSLLLAGLKADQGSAGMAVRLRELARNVVAPLQGEVQSKTGNERTEAIVKIMNGLSYEAEVDEGPGGAMPSIKAHNCVYHHLAQEFPEICAFDLEMLERLSGAPVDHQECIIRGGNVCRFAFRKQVQGE